VSVSNVLSTTHLTWISQLNFCSADVSVWLCTTASTVPELRLQLDESDSVFRHREGRLEVYYNDIWGTICGRRFNDVAAKIACDALGFG